VPGRAKLVGADALVHRITAVQQVPKALRGAWATSALEMFRAAIPKRTGDTVASLRAEPNGRRGPDIAGSPVVFFIDHGVREHEIVPKVRKALKWDQAGKPQFAKRVNAPRTRARPMRARIAREAFRKAIKAKGANITDAWNSAA
jgi:hypothetical protein